MIDGARILLAINELRRDMQGSYRDHDARLRDVETQLAAMAERIDPSHEERIRKLEFSAARYGVIGAGIATAFGFAANWAIRSLTGNHNG